MENIIEILAYLAYAYTICLYHWGYLHAMKSFLQGNALLFVYPSCCVLYVESYHYVDLYFDDDKSYELKQCTHYEDVIIF